MEITYRLIAKSAILLKHFECTGWSLLKNKELTIPATILRGGSRFQFEKDPKSLQTEQFKKLKNDLYGGQDSAAAMIFTDAKCITPEKLSSHSFIKINPTTGMTEQNIFTFPSVQPGTVFEGKVYFKQRPIGIERCIALSSLLEIPNILSHGNHGFGQVEVEIINRSTTTVFISYSWDDSDHMEWVFNLTKKIMENGVDVILDQLSSSFDINAPQNKINEWMIQCLNNCDKIIAILTPNYCQKAENHKGGVGFEYKQLVDEKNKLSLKLSRYIGVLRKGNREESLPSYFKTRPIIDMRNSFEGQELNNLIQAINNS